MNETVKWSGCNYYINQGANEHEPLGTAMSMHDCMGCKKFDFCTVKQDSEVWKWDTEIEKELCFKINLMNEFE